MLHPLQTPVVVGATTSVINQLSTVVARYLAGGRFSISYDPIERRSNLPDCTVLFKKTSIGYFFEVPSLYNVLTPFSALVCILAIA